MPTADVMGRLAAFEKAFHARAERAMVRVAEKLQEWAKEEHKFTNRSGDLEKSIAGFMAQAGPHLVRAVLKAGTDHAQFLEGGDYDLARSGEWAFLWPVMVRHEREIWEIIVREMKGG
jgi:hypothetical protein